MPQYNLPSLLIQGSKLVNVVILDVNDNSPVFQNSPTTNVSLGLSEVSLTKECILCGISNCIV